MQENKLFPDTRLYAACEIYSHPPVTARPARPEDPETGKQYQPARRARPARRGILPIGRTQFERLRASGKFPKPDAELNGRTYWTGNLLNSVLLKRGADKSTSPNSTGSIGVVQVAIDGP